MHICDLFNYFIPKGSRYFHRLVPGSVGHCRFFLNGDSQSREVHSNDRKATGAVRLLWLLNVSPSGQQVNVCVEFRYNSQQQLPVGGRCKVPFENRRHKCFRIISWQKLLYRFLLCCSFFFIIIQPFI